MKILRKHASVSPVEHDELALHFAAIRHHLRRILTILSGRARTTVLDRLARIHNGAGPLGRIRSDLDGDAGRVDYYGREAECATRWQPPGGR
jgi:hypothetical protein